jgi:hypothetical protein
MWWNNSPWIPKICVKDHVEWRRYIFRIKWWWVVARDSTFTCFVTLAKCFPLPWWSICLSVNWSKENWHVRSFRGLDEILCMVGAQWVEWMIIMCNLWPGSWKVLLQKYQVVNNRIPYPDLTICVIDDSENQSCNLSVSNVSSQSPCLCVSSEWDNEGCRCWLVSTQKHESSNH